MRSSTFPQPASCLVSPADIGKAFVSHYYTTFPHATRANLQTLFNDQSLLTWEGNPSQQFMGMTNIMTHLVVRAAPLRATALAPSAVPVRLNR